MQELEYEWNLQIEKWLREEEERRRRERQTQEQITLLSSKNEQLQGRCLS